MESGDRQRHLDLYDVCTPELRHTYYILGRPLLQTGHARANTELVFISVLWIAQQVTHLPRVGYFTSPWHRHQTKESGDF